MIVDTEVAPVVVGSVQRREWPSRAHRRLRVDIGRGLRHGRPWLPTRLLYMGDGGRRFDRVAADPGYPIGRMERAILARHAGTIARRIEGRHVVEIGGGGSDKLGPLLASLDGGRLRFTAFDVDDAGVLDALGRMSDAIDRRMLTSLVVGDFERDLSPMPRGGGGRVVAMLGGTIGNLPTRARRRLLAVLGTELDVGEQVLLGVDLERDPGRQVERYASTAVARFNLGVVDTLATTFGVHLGDAGFVHAARWDEVHERVLVELVATRAAAIGVPGPDGFPVRFVDGTRVRTAVSTKFGIDGIERELDHAGFAVELWSFDDSMRYGIVLARRT